MIKQERERGERDGRNCVQKSAPIFSCPIVLCFSSLVLLLRRKFFLLQCHFYVMKLMCLWEVVIFLNPLMLLPIKSTYNVITPYFNKCDNAQQVKIEEKVMIGLRENKSIDK